MKHSMITNQAFINQSQPDSGRESTNMQRRTLISGAFGAALAGLLSSPGRVMAKGNAAPNDPFILLLKGVYQPVPEGQGPVGNLGLTTVDLSDGSYTVTKIYPIFVGIPDSKNQGKAIGNFYVSLATGLCAYDLPGGAPSGGGSKLIASAPLGRS